MSVCLCVCKLKLSSFWRFLKVPEGPSRFLKVPGGFWRFLKFSESSWRFLKVSEGSWRFLRVSEGLKVSEGLWRFLMVPKGSWRFLKVLFEILSHSDLVFILFLVSMQLHWFVCNSISLHAVLWAFMKLFNFLPGQLTRTLPLYGLVLASRN